MITTTQISLGQIEWFACLNPFKPNPILSHWKYIFIDLNSIAE